MAKMGTPCCVERANGSSERASVDSTGASSVTSRTPPASGSPQSSATLPRARAVEHLSTSPLPRQKSPPPEADPRALPRSSSCMHFGHGEEHSNGAASGATSEAEPLPAELRSKPMELTEDDGSDARHLSDEDSLSTLNTSRGGASELCSSIGETARARDDGKAARATDSSKQWSEANEDERSSDALGLSAESTRRPCGAKEAVRRSLHELAGFLNGQLTDREENDDNSTRARPDTAVAAIAGVESGRASVENKRASVYNFLQIPMRLERLLILGTLICADEFLTLFTVLPLRCFKSLLRSGRGQAARENGHGGGGRSSAVVNAAVDWASLSLLLITTSVLSMYNISWVYHNIRGQNVIKLYVIFNIVEIFDRLCSSFGMDVFDMLGASIADAALLLLERNKRSANKTTYMLAFSKLAFDYMCSVVYSVVHASLIFVWVVTLNVAVNSSNNMLLVLLVSNNFVELKSVVLKQFKLQNMFQIACSDAVERFQMFAFLTSILAFTFGDDRVRTTWLIVFGYELIVDWIKHSFAAKFNSISHQVYKTFALFLCRDFIASRRNSVAASIGGSRASKRLGFVSVPIAAVSLRSLSSMVVSLPSASILLVILLLMTLKATLSVALLGHCYRQVQQSRSSRQTHMENNEWSSSYEEDNLLKLLNGVHRYSVRPR